MQNLLNANPAMSLNNMILQNSILHGTNPMADGSQDYKKYIEMLILSMILGQIPTLANTFIKSIINLIQEYLTILISWISQLSIRSKPRKKHKFSKSYKYKQSFKKYVSSSRNKEIDPTPGLEDLNHILEYIENLDFLNTAIDKVDYRYFTFHGTMWRIPLLDTDVNIEIKPGLFMYWEISSETRDVDEDNKDKTDKDKTDKDNTEKTEKKDKNDLDKSKKCDFIKLEQNVYILVTIYSNNDKDLITHFEDELKLKKKMSETAYKNIQTINFLSSSDDKTKWISYKFNTTKSFDNIFLPEKEKIMNLLNTFCHNKDLFCRLGKQNYLGILLYGLPGCGKTSLIKAIAKYTDRSIFVVKLADVLGNKALKNIFQYEEVQIVSRITNIANGTYQYPFNKRIIVIEDIDVDIKYIQDREISLKDEKTTADVVEKLTNRVNQLVCSDKGRCSDLGDRPSDTSEKPDDLSKLLKSLEKLTDIMDVKDWQKRFDNSFSLDVFLNVLDGIQEQNGTIFIMTSNYPEKIDRALIRPGRCDLHVNFRKTDMEIFKQMLQYYYKTEYNESHMTTELLNNIHDKYTASEICQMFYENSYDLLLKKLNRTPNE